MWTRSVLCVAAACLFSTAAAAGQTAPTPPANDDCLVCHGDADAKRADGRSIAVDAKHLEASIHGPLGCVDCHAEAGKELPHPDKLAKVSCGSCHDDVAGKYHDSMHAWAKEKAGLVGAPSCADCHGTHDITPHTATTSRVYRDRIPATCGSCHAGIEDKYNAGVHAAALRKGASNAPVCVDCHTTHAITRTDTDAWRLSVTGECGTCHATVVESFRRTFHGKVTELGFTRVAACADCHGAHDILPAANRASKVSKARLVETCGTCHPGANERFVQYDPHPNPRDYSRSAVLWWANRFYWLLIPGCFGFFGLHSVLWYWRSKRDGGRS
jgi:nitrate/TMAO reductase-like tetraheme cytochrome c subunit